MLQMCPSCRGSKKVIRLGFVEKNCEQCGGIGKIKQLEEQKKTEISFETINEGVELFRKYPEKPEEHYKEATDRYSETLSGVAANEQKKSILEKPKNLKGSSSHGKDRKGK